MVRKLDVAVACMAAVSMLMSGGALLELRAQRRCVATQELRLTHPGPGLHGGAEVSLGVEYGMLYLAARGASGRHNLVISVAPEANQEPITVHRYESGAVSTAGQSWLVPLVPLGDGGKPSRADQPGPKAIR